MNTGQNHADEYKAAPFGGAWQRAGFAPQSGRFGTKCRTNSLLYARFTRQSDRWSRRRESNPHLPLRRRPFYPLNYGETTRNCRGSGGQAFRSRSQVAPDTGGRRRTCAQAGSHPRWRGAAGETGRAGGLCDLQHPAGGEPRRGRGVHGCEPGLRVVSGGGDPVAGTDRPADGRVFRVVASSTWYRWFLCRCARAAALRVGACGGR